jgi:hypothetical protein
MIKAHNFNVVRPLPKRIRIGVPPGVGDTYWALCKLESFRERHGIEHVTLCVKKAELKRALAWPSMVDCVDAAEEFEFGTNPGIRETGFSCRKPGVDVVMWPNAVIDRGEHLRNWMPEYELNLDIEIKTPPIWSKFMNRHVIYASSEGVNREWFPDRGPGFWRHLINEIADQTGERPLLIGAGWDKDFFRAIEPVEADSLISETTLPEVAGLIKHAKSLTGMISGMTILGNHFRTPTVAIYPDRFMPGFLTSWIKPDTPYVPLMASLVPASKVVARITKDLAG